MGRVAWIIQIKWNKLNEKLQADKNAGNKNTIRYSFIAAWT